MAECRWEELGMTAKADSEPLEGGVGRPRGSAGATWAPLALNFLSRVGGHVVVPMQVVLDFILGLRSLKCVKFY